MWRKLWIHETEGHAFSCGRRTVKTNDYIMNYICSVFRLAAPFELCFPGPTVQQMVLGISMLVIWVRVVTVQQMVVGISMLVMWMRVASFENFFPSYRKLETSSFGLAFKLSCDILRPQHPCMGTILDLATA